MSQTIVLKILQSLPQQICQLVGWWRQKLLPYALLSFSWKTWWKSSDHSSRKALHWVQIQYTVPTKL